MIQLDSHSNEEKFIQGAIAPTVVFVALSLSPATLLAANPMAWACGDECTSKGNPIDWVILAAFLIWGVANIGLRGTLGAIFTYACFAGLPLSMGISYVSFSKGNEDRGWTYLLIAVVCILWLRFWMREPRKNDPAKSSDHANNNNVEHNFELDKSKSAATQPLTNQENSAIDLEFFQGSYGSETAVTPLNINPEDWFDHYHTEVINGKKVTTVYPTEAAKINALSKSNTPLSLMSSTVELDKLGDIYHFGNVRLSYEIDHTEDDIYEWGLDLCNVVRNLSKITIAGHLESDALSREAVINYLKTAINEFGEGLTSAIVHVANQFILFVESNHINKYQLKKAELENHLKIFKNNLSDREELVDIYGEDLVGFIGKCSAEEYCSFIGSRVMYTDDGRYSIS